jgi:hypothetical protein
MTASVPHAQGAMPSALKSRSETLADDGKRDHN